LERFSLLKIYDKIKRVDKIIHKVVSLHGFHNIITKTCYDRKKGERETV